MGKVDMHAHEFVVQEESSDGVNWYLLKRQNAEQHVSGDLMLKIVLTVHPRWRPAMQGGYALFKRNYAQAISSLTDAIMEFKENSNILFELYEFRCTAFMGSKMYLQAKEDVQSMTNINRNHPSCFYFLGRVAVALEDYDQAIQAYSAGLEINPSNNRLQHALSSLKKNALEQTIRKSIADSSKALKTDNPDLAVSIITDSLLEHEPNNPTFYFYRSIAHIASGKFDLAEKDIKTCCDKNPNWPKHNPTKQGKMSKRGRINPASQDRYFFLQDRFLFYYKTIKSREYQGFIILQNAQLECNKKELYIKANSASSNSSRIFQITAPSAADASEWVTAFKAAARLPLLLPVEEQLATVSMNNLNSLSQPISSSSSSSMTYQTSSGNSPNSLLSTSPSISSSASMAVASSTTISASAHTQVVVPGIVHEGWLFKAGEINTSFKKRWFVLRNEILYYFKGRPEAKEDVYTGVKGTIQVTKFMAQPVPTPAYAFSLLPHNPKERSYLLHASSDEDRQRWLEVISLELLRVHATLTSKDAERAALEESADDEQPHGNNNNPNSSSMSDLSSLTKNPARGFSNSVSNSTGPNPVNSNHNGDGDHEILDLNALRSRSSSKYYGNHSHHQGLNSRHSGDEFTNRRQSLIFAERPPINLGDLADDSDDEYSRLIGRGGRPRSGNGVDDDDDSDHEPLDSDSKGCCSSCSIQ